jgi:hypothetical protein
MDLDHFQLLTSGSAPDGLIEIEEGLLFPGGEGVFDGVG